MFFFPYSVLWRGYKVVNLKLCIVTLGAMLCIPRIAPLPLTDNHHMNRLLNWLCLINAVGVFKSNYKLSVGNSVLMWQTQLECDLR